MTSPKRSPRKTTRKAPADLREQTLMQFSAAIDEHAGRVVGFAELAMTLAGTRSQIADLASLRRAWFSKVRDLHRSGVRAVGGVELRESTPSVPEVYRAVESAAVKKVDKMAWQRAQAVVPYVSVKPPASWKWPDLDVAVPPEPKAAADPSAVGIYRDHPAWQRLKELRQVEEEIIASLSKIGADFGWDGLPITFADGWTVGLSRMQFSGEKLKAIDPELWDRVAVSKIRQTPAKVYLAKGGGDGAVDLDAD